MGVSDSNLISIGTGRVASKWVAYVIGFSLAIVQTPSLCLALSIEFDYGSGFPVGSPARVALDQAASAWESVLADPVTIKIDADFAPCPGCSAVASPGNFANYDYATVRQALARDQTSQFDIRAVSSLEKGPSFNFITDPFPYRGSQDPQQIGYALFQGGTSPIETQLGIGGPEAKALGLTPPPSSNGDGFLSFSSTEPWQFTRDNGIAQGKVDFVGVAEHELGHVLGFHSGVDLIDAYLCNSAQAAQGCISLTLEEVQQFAQFSPLDLYRYSPLSRDLSVQLGVPVRDLSVTAIRGSQDEPKLFSLNNGATSLAQFATGTFNGDGFQASHWKNGTPALMPPTLPGRHDITLLDLFAMDAIGWNVRPFMPVSAPEPHTLLVVVSGFLGLLWLKRRGELR